jgi:DNA-3-methyladenine glycosylase II
MSYKKHLYKDAKLALIIGDELFDLELKKNIPLQLVRSIMGQQLSTKVAEVIFNRFLSLFKGKVITPKNILQKSQEELRVIGLSFAKINYVYNVCNFCIENKITDKSLHKLNDDQIIDLLTQIKGVGRWTVEMLLMFTLAREDVFAVDDLGIQQAMIKLYNLPTDNKKELKLKMIEISKKWSPYKTYACLHLWAFKDDKTL